MKRVEYTEHLKIRLRLRSIPAELPRIIYQESQERYRDNATNLFVVVSNAEYAGKMREMAVIFTEDEQTARLITIHPLKPNQKLQRILFGRWKKL